MNQIASEMALPRTDPDNDDQHSDDVSLAGPVSRKLVSRAVNPRHNRQVLVCLTRTDRIAHHAMVAGELERNQRLVQEPDEQELGREEVAVLPGPVDRLTDMAAKMLGAEKDLN